MKKNYDIKKFEPMDKENETKIAKKFQKKLFFSKFFYYYIAIIGVIFFLEKNNFIFDSVLGDQVFILIMVLFWILGLYSIISTLIFGICPYCQRFQKLNGKAVGVDSSSISYTRGVSPFIKYCTRCGAPLSEKAVKEVYEKLEKGNASTPID
ncbi:hypothetical protein [Neisseria dentiae]|uniref:hypothetical protein n=1 Tax=Neisseria dentiae TaxID=194197 RepID=UPI00211C14BC|nr:hypothetical protein [Neisseria dentiae]MCQ9327718.1 hypothetical protein [Neisseria dentiae]